MKQLVVAPGYYQTVLHSIYKQGPDTNFSDVTLKCEDSVFHGHKCILSSQSEYFKALFQGNFSDSNSSEIDLSSVFEDEQSFEQVMQFFYTGVVDFVDIFLLARYASFFQFKPLKELCDEEMQKCVGLQNCVTYYTFAKSADYYWIEDMTTDVIKKRFHDYFIHQDDTLQLCPSDLQELLDIDCLTYSSACDILEFIAKWVLSDMTTQRIVVGQHALDYLKKREQIHEDRISEPLKPGVESYCCQLEAKLNDLPDVDKGTGHTFIDTFQTIIELLPKSEDASSEEVALFTLSKRKKLDLSLFEEAGDETPIEHFSTGKHKNWETAYDICLYRPSTKLWYNIESIENKPCNYFDEDFIPKSGRLLPFDKQSCELNYIHGKLMFSSRLSDEILIYNCDEKKWNSLETETEVETKESDDFISSLLRRCRSRRRDLSTIGHHVFVWNENVFVIKVKVWGSGEYEHYLYYNPSEFEDDVDNISGVYFEIYQMDELSGCLTLMLKSSIQSYICKRYIGDMKNHECLRSFVIAKASKSMDEVLVVCLLSDDTSEYDYTMTEKCMSFVANIGDRSIHFFPPETCDKLSYQPDALFIFEDTEGFLVAVNIDIWDDACQVVGAYKYLSQDLKLVDGLCDPPDRPDDTGEYQSIERYLPTTSGNSSLWYFYGSFLYHNDFQNVKFNKSEDGKYYESTSTEYTPHPFTTLVAAVETKGNADIFKKLKPSCFLG